MRLLICSVLLITIGQVSVADDVLIDNITVYVAKKIITMGPAFPEAQIAYKTNKRCFASNAEVLERYLVPFSPRSIRTLLELTAQHCPVPQGTFSIVPRSHLEVTRCLLVFPPMPVFRPADTLSKPFLVATRVKQENSAALAKQVGLWRRARVVNPYP